MSDLDRPNGSEDFGLPPYLSADFPPPSSKVTVTFGAATRKARSHRVNDDNYAIVQLGRHQETLMTSLPEGAIRSRFDESGYAMVVADGIGGSDSESASRLAIATLMHLTLHFGRWNLRIDDVIAHEVMARADRFYRHVDTTLVHYGLLHQAPRPQSTLTAVFGAGRDLFFAHVGHSRAYLGRRGELLRLTRDHTVGPHRTSHASIAPLVDVNAVARDLKHILTDTIGMTGPTGPIIDLERFQIEHNDRVLVCTNGLTDAVDDTAIQDILASDRSPNDQCVALVEAATAARASDDATALIAQYHVPE